MRVKAYREIRIIGRNIAISKDIVNPRLLKRTAIIRARVVRPFVLPNYYFCLEAMRKVESIAAIVYVRRL